MSIVNGCKNRDGEGSGGGESGDGEGGGGCESRDGEGAVRAEMAMDDVE